MSENMNRKLETKEIGRCFPFHRKEKEWYMKNMIMKEAPSKESEMKEKQTFSLYTSLAISQTLGEAPNMTFMCNQLLRISVF